MRGATSNRFFNLDESDDHQIGNDSEEEFTKSQLKSKRKKLDDGKSWDIESEDEDNDGAASRDGNDTRRCRTPPQEKDNLDEVATSGASSLGNYSSTADKAVSEAKSIRPKLKFHFDKPLLHKNIITTDETIKKSGVIYLSRIPPFLKPSKLRSLLAPYGTINRIFLSPEDPLSHARRVRAGGNKKRSFTEGWVEFVRKKDAKRTAELLNTRPIGGRKGNYYYDDMWSMIYLRGFKWRDLTGQIAAEDAERASRMRAELTRATKSDREFARNIEQSKQITGMKRKRQEKESKDAGTALVPTIGTRPGETRMTFRQVSQAKGYFDDSQDTPANVTRALGKIF